MDFKSIILPYFYYLYLPYALPALHHIPALVLAITQIFGGMYWLYNPRDTISVRDLPDQAANPLGVYNIMIIGGTRTIAIGVVMLVFHYQGKYEEVDTVAAVLGLAMGVISAHFAWTEEDKEEDDVEDVGRRLGSGLGDFWDACWALRFKSEMGQDRRRHLAKGRVENNYCLRRTS